MSALTPSPESGEVHVSPDSIPKLNPNPSPTWEVQAFDLSSDQTPFRMDEKARVEVLCVCCTPGRQGTYRVRVKSQG